MRNWMKIEWKLNFGYWCIDIFVGQADADADADNDMILNIDF